MFSNFIKKIKGREILTSRGIPTVEIELDTTFGKIISSCPSGASTVSEEAVVLVDNDKRYNGKSVENVIKRFLTVFEKYKNELYKLNSCDIYGVDKILQKMDGTKNLSKLGANTILPTSLSFCRLSAKMENSSLYGYIAKISNKKPKLPNPHFNVINGGVHSGNDLDIQEIMISFNRSSFSENLECAVIFYQKLKEIIKSKYGGISINVGDEGGFAPPIQTLEDGLDLIIETKNILNINDLDIVIDSAANSFYKNEKYCLNVRENKKSVRKELTTDELIEYYKKIITNYKIIKIWEDPFAEKDFHGWKRFTKESGIIVLGDDLIVTNKEKVEMAIKEELCNAILVKPNQIGYVTGAIDAINKARDANMLIMVSHRSAETMDSFISDFAVGTASDFIKSGAPCRGERVEKYNQLLRIEEEMNENK
ncbi:Enolase [Spraguea lophii 42_110]|uniref:phosphopyruvate hydratase n=1 Tax=Spraguea lophii (strain 42_110) TaxID=1358809 RepID=S7W8P6_SPRLO|nr:Enolase [Spraguea lophii 42_110]